LAKLIDMGKSSGKKIGGQKQPVKVLVKASKPGLYQQNPLKNPSL
jgi:hypothetical protein